MQRPPPPAPTTTPPPTTTTSPTTLLLLLKVWPAPSVHTQNTQRCIRIGTDIPRGTIQHNRSHRRTTQTHRHAALPPPPSPPPTPHPRRRLRREDFLHSYLRRLTPPQARRGSAAARAAAACWAWSCLCRAALTAIVFSVAMNKTTLHLGARSDLNLRCRRRQLLQPRRRMPLFTVRRQLLR